MEFGCKFLDLVVSKTSIPVVSIFSLLHLKRTPSFLLKVCPQICQADITGVSTSSGYFSVGC